MAYTTAKPIGHMTHSFENYPINQHSRSKFDMSHSLITTMNAGYLVPIYHKLAYPGDTMILSTRTLTRLATQIVPFMDNVYMDIHFWAVPWRLIWSHTKQFFGEDDTFEIQTDYLTPQITLTGSPTVMSIFDYFGVPLASSGASFNAFNFRAYNLIWNENYRDENLQSKVTVELGDTDDPSNYTLLKRGKRKDYFTACLPLPQKGPAVDLPLGTDAPVYASASQSLPLSFVNGTGSDVQSLHYYHKGSSGDYVDTNGTANAPLGVTPSYNSITSTSSFGNLSQVVTPANLFADLSSATAATINSLRTAFALQRYYEIDALGGTRYIEKILAHFGVKSPDARQQRPEFLGGGTFNLNLSVVPQTSATSSNSPHRNLSSFGVINGETRKIVHSFTEHCVVIGLASIRADYTYQQGLHCDYSKRAPSDYYFPEFANLGEKAVLNKEIFCQGPTVVDSDANVVDEKVFGYQERWAEMRTSFNEITGLMRSDATGSLDFWHLSQDFASCPSLNSTFIEEAPPIARVLAVSGDGTCQFLSSFFFDDQWVRVLPVYSIPSSISHF